MQPPVEDVTVTDSELPEGDGIDEYNTVQLMHIYEASLEAIPSVLPLSMGPNECETYGSIVGNAQFWIGFFDQDHGFWSTAPDELQYLLTEKQVKQDVAPMIDAYCSRVS